VVAHASAESEIKPNAQGMWELLLWLKIIIDGWKVK